MADGNRQSILVVDDVTENIAVLNAILKDTYNVLFAKSGKMTFDVLEKSTPDLILLDIVMDGMDGYEVCRRLKANPITKAIPVIFVTAQNEEFYEVKGFELGAVDYITKPVSPALVKKRVSTQLALYDQNRVLEKKVQQRTAEIEQTRSDVIHKLGIAAEYKDNDTGLHVMRMSKYCYLIAKQYGLSEQDALILKEASPMHDIGKIGIADNILLKSGKLDDEEWQVMTTHCAIGGEIIGKYDSGLFAIAGIVAKQHHEKFNGKGYPLGLVGEAIDINARIVAVADVFDALTSVRPYKYAWDVDKAISLINEEASQHFDPDVVEAFNGCLENIMSVKEEYKEID
jgi:putative two-component system response regulator